MAVSAGGSSAPGDVYAFAYDQDAERVLRYRVSSAGVVQQATIFIRDERHRCQVDVAPLRGTSHVSCQRPTES